MIMSIPYNNRKPINKKWYWALALILVFSLFVSVATLTNATGTGGYVSESLIGSSSGASNFTIDSSGASGSYLDVSTVGTIVTNKATGIGTASANLNATVSTLNGMPRGVVYFEWGYDATYGNVTSSATITSPQDVQIAVNGYDPDKEIYYRAVVETDGTAVGSGRFFTVGGLNTGLNIWNNIILLLLGLAMVIVAIKLFSMNVSILEVVSMLVILVLCYWIVHYIISLI